MILCLGETLLRFVPLLGSKWIENATMEAHIGGAELNTAYALAKWDIQVAYATALPHHSLADEIIGHMSQNKIDTSRIKRKEGRIGIYYLPKGGDIKNSGVVYDRCNSTFANLTYNDIEFDVLLKDIHWLHLSAISPALGINSAELCIAVMNEAKARGIKISFDLNYRSKLWQYTAEPHILIKEMMPYCDVIMGNLWSAHALLDIDLFLENNKETDKEKLIEATSKSMLAVHHLYPHVQTMAYTFRFDTHYYSIVQHGPECVISETEIIDVMKDKVGSGDTYMAALIYGLEKQWATKNIVDFCNKAAVYKLGEYGDHTEGTIASILKLKNQ